MDFIIRPVETKTDKLKFVKSQWNFYPNDRSFVPPVIQDRMKLLDTEKNPFYKHSDIKLFLAERNGKVIGRIAGITNENHNTTHNDNLGFFGFFECIDDAEVANALFAEAEKWVKEQGKDAIRGPVNPSTNDELGILVEGFNAPPVALMTYNPPHYENLILKSNYSQVKELYAYHLNETTYLGDKMKRLEGMVRKRHNVTVKSLNFKDNEQFKKDINVIKDIYNTAWEPNWGFVKLTDEEFDFMAKDFRQFADEDFALIVYINDEPAGFCLGIPDINQVLIHNKRGSFVGAAYHLLTKKKTIDTLRIIILGVLPKFQRTGIDTVLYYEIGSRGLKKGIRKGEASWILEDNLMMNRGLQQTMNAHLYKKYRLYEKNLD